MLVNVHPPSTSHLRSIVTLTFQISLLSFHQIHSLIKRISHRINQYRIEVYHPLSNMKNILAILLLVPLAAVTAKGTPKPQTDQQVCQGKNAKVVAAIQKFCSNTYILAPSTYAMEGVDLNGIIVNIMGECSPPQ